MSEENKVEEVAGAVTDAAGDAGEKAKDTGAELMEQGKDLLNKAGDMLGGLVNKAEEAFKMDINRDGKVGGGEGEEKAE